VPADAASAPRTRALRLLRAGALGGIALGALLIGVLHVVPPTDAIDPLAVTISEYGRTTLGAVFAAAVVLIAAGSAAALALFLHDGACRAASAATLGIALWVLGLLAVAVFPKADWAAGASATGHLHRAASVVAFVALPIAILTLCGPRGRPFGRRGRTAALVIAVAALVAIAVVGVYVVAAEAAGSPWWTTFPLGLAERVLVFGELAALVLLVLGLRLRRAPARRALPR